MLGSDKLPHLSEMTNINAGPLLTTNELIIIKACFQEDKKIDKTENFR